MKEEAKLESKFKKAILKAGGKSYKFVSPAHRGVSDQIVLVPGGVTVYTEIKDGNKALSPLQLIFQRDTLAMGHKHEVIRFEKDIPVFIEKYFWHLS